MTNYKTGDEIVITVGKRKFTTIIDKHGVQRFKTNTVINAFFEASGKEFDKWLTTDRSQPQPFNLNVLVLEYHNGKHTLDDMLTLYTSIGYSVGGFSDVSIFEELDIRNPVWEADDYKILSNSAWKELMGLINEPYEHNGNDAVRFIFDTVSNGEWQTDGNGNFIAGSDTIDRVVKSFLWSKGEISPWDIIVKDDTSEELKKFIFHMC